MKETFSLPGIELDIEGGETLRDKTGIIVPIVRVQRRERWVEMLS